MKTLEEALAEIEYIVRQIDPLLLYQSHLVKELQNIVRRVRVETHNETTKEISRA